MKDGHVLVWPNTIPFNGMLLSGKLPFKTRSDYPLHDYRGMVLFYNSTKYAKQRDVLGDGLDPKLFKKQAIIGQGYLTDVRELTNAEMADFSSRCKGIYGAFPLGYFFTALSIYNHPIPASWPQGCVRGGWVKPCDIQPALARAYSENYPEEFDTYRLPISGKIFKAAA